MKKFGSERSRLEQILWRGLADYVYPAYRATFKRILPKRWEQIIVELGAMTLRLGYIPNIWSPRTFNEKVVHRKLFQYDPRFARCADKWQVRSYVADYVGEEYLTRVYGRFLDADSLRHCRMPGEFVLKASHGSGMTLICNEQLRIDRARLVEVAREWLGRAYGEETHEYWYSEIAERSVIMEELLEDQQYGTPLDFKFFVFRGHVKLIEVDMDRFTQHKQRFYDREWRCLPVKRERPLGPEISAPKRLEEMIDIAETLGRPFDFVRVDLYSPNDERVVFGELTFSPAAGWGRFWPKEWDWVVGRYW